MALPLTLHRDSKNISEKTNSQIGGLRKVKIISETDVWPKPKILELGDGWVSNSSISSALKNERLKPNVEITYSLIKREKVKSTSLLSFAGPSLLVPQTSVNVKGLKGEGLCGLCGSQ